MYGLFIVAGFNYGFGQIAWHTAAYFVNVMGVTTLTVGFNKFLSTFEMVWVFIFNVYYGGVSPLGHERGSTLVWKRSMCILSF